MSFSAFEDNENGSGKTHLMTVTLPPIYLMTIAHAAAALERF